MGVLENGDGGCVNSMELVRTEKEELHYFVQVERKTCGARREWKGSCNC